MAANKRWMSDKGYDDFCPNVDAFLEEILGVCRRHGMSISHEDFNGSFVVTRFNNRDAEWLNAANVDMPSKE